MKKLLLLLILIVATSCHDGQPKTQSANQIILTKYVGDEIRVYDVEHNGHQYIVFHVKGGYGEALQVLHDPDCECKK
jgi:ribosomal protein S19